MAICFHESYALHFDNVSYVGCNNKSFMHNIMDMAIQMILILHDSHVLCKLHILERNLDHFSCPVLLHESNVVFTNKISCCQMQCINFK